MCGLAGRFHPERLPPAADWRFRAGRLLAHRGPDGVGHFGDDACELVHRRLALLDLTPTGRQPMANEDGTVLVVFNGEIYNHQELRRRLVGLGHVFRGTSDTEVLVHLYEEHGDRFAERLRGIFALAIYDRARRRVVLARDRFGVKPLFFALHEGQLLFASEMKAILALPGFVPALDRQACYDYLGLGFVPEPATGFANIQALPRGTLVTAGPHLLPRLTPFCEPAAAPDPALTLTGAVERVEEAMLQAVAAQAVADVPVAALLSGGIDSSLVVAARGRATGARTATFGVRFPDPRHDESAAARAVAEHCGTEHYPIELGDRALTTDALLALLRHFDQPFADTSLIPMYWVAQAVRDRGIVCTLSGDGGDEAFGGYPTFWRTERLARLMALPTWMRRAAHLAGGAFATRTRDWGRQLAKAAALAEAGASDSAALLAGLASYLTEDQKAALTVPEARRFLLPAWRLFDGFQPPGTSDVEELSRRLTATLFAVGLPSDMLRKVDMMSMRASIEVRVPLLDEAVAGLGLTLPHRLKTDGRRGKLVLRQLARRWLPAAVVRRPKHGFTIPLDLMVPAEFHRTAEDLLCADDARTRPVLAGPLVRRWLAAFRDARHGRAGGAISRAGLYQRVFTVLALELWMRDHRLSW